MWARAAWAALACVVVMFAGMGDGYAIVKNDRATKVCIMRVTKDVPVFIGTVGINTEPTLAILNAHHFISGQRPLCRALALDCLVGTQNATTGISPSYQGKIEWQFKRIFHDASSRDDAQLVGRRLTGVRNCNRHDDFIFQNIINRNAGSSGNNISSQLPLGGILSKRDGFPGGVGRVLCGLGRPLGISQALAHVAQLNEEKQGLAYANNDEPKGEKTSRVFREPRRPSEFGIWALGFVALSGSFLLFYGLCWAGGLFLPNEKHSSRKDGDR